MSSFLVVLAACCFLALRVRAERNADRKLVDVILTKQDRFILEEKGKDLAEINASGHLLNRVETKPGGLQILIIAVASQPEAKLRGRVERAPVKSTCLDHRERTRKTPGSKIVPECDENGDYKELQCHSAHRSMCQCWDKDGSIIAGFRQNIVNCKCIVHKIKASRRKQKNVFVPRCEENGNYAPKQCFGDTGMCWCVDSDGKRLGEPTTFTIVCH
ncbi:U24-ctenitoxin-Pn1a-like [Centruroides sculpturatus]|uniref:U24-ctenitoxin-Pn1a-like n=1 Tax=Centruroides sculpturatus TaxID=218467 RepID=UPI000C6DBADE|nr:U24-ctenitoxin-Pn1a-like [Centruroides sculpturatus]